MLFGHIVITIWVYRLKAKIGLYYVNSTRRWSKVLICNFFAELRKFKSKAKTSRKGKLSRMFHLLGV